jgi:hypothetical protein
MIDRIARKLRVLKANTPLMADQAPSLSLDLGT